MKNQSLLVYSIIMFFLTTAILMLIILKDNRPMYVEETYDAVFEVKELIIEIPIRIQGFPFIQ
jgi:hypothetical protein